MSRWARTLIEDATGYYTGSVYIDKSLGRQGLIGEYEDPHNGRTIAIKLNWVETAKKVFIFYENKNIDRFSKASN